MVTDEPPTVYAVTETLANDAPKPIEVITVNFEKGEIVNKISFDEEGGIPKIFRELAKLAKKQDYKSFALMTIDSNNHVDWVFVGDSEHHMALAALCIDDLKDDIKAKIFGYPEEE